MTDLPNDECAAHVPPSTYMAKVNAPVVHTLDPHEYEYDEHEMELRAKAARTIQKAWRFRQEEFRQATSLHCTQKLMLPIFMTFNLLCFFVAGALVVILIKYRILEEPEHVSNWIFCIVSAGVCSSSALGKSPLERATTLLHARSTRLGLYTWS